MARYDQLNGLLIFLFLVLSIDNPEVLAPFLDYADDLEVRDGIGWTPLMTAVNRGSKQNVNMLLARGAKVDCDWAKGMSLIADAMNFNDAGKIEKFRLKL
jgi:ankyrin repeat protein